MSNMLVQLTSEDLKQLIADTIEEKFKQSDTFPIVDNFKKLAYSVKELAEILGISRPTIDNWKKSGLKCCNVGGRVFFLEEHVKEFLLQHTNS